MSLEIRDCYESKYPEEWGLRACRLDPSTFIFVGGQESRRAQAEAQQLLLRIYVQGW